MMHKKFKLGIVVFFLFAVHLEAAHSEARTLDKPCNYNLTAEGKKTTYRELLVMLLKTYKMYAADPQKDPIVAEIEKAMTLFGASKQPYMDYLQWIEKGFNYTLFKKSKSQFYNAIADNDFPWPYTIPQGQAQGYHVYDVHYALLGILQYNAYLSTGGDS